MNEDAFTRATRARYNRIAVVYDLMEAFIERTAFAAWRQRLWASVPAGRVLEVGVGTGKNLPYYPAGAQVTAIDLSERMLERARRRATDLGVRVDLRLMDAQRLAFPAGAFDAAVATFVFCSVPDPVQGLRELGWEPDYLSVRRRADLQAPQRPEELRLDAHLVALGAARLGRTRLIDNLEF